MFFALSNGYNFNRFKEIMFFQNVEPKVEKKIHSIFLFQFKLGRKTAEIAREINQAFGIGTTTEPQHSDGLRNYMPVIKVLKMMNVVVGHQM